MAELPAKPSSVSNSTAPARVAVLPCEQDSTIVEFRPKLSYRGEFGFDWLRVKEAPTSGVFEKEPYIDNPNEIGSGGVIGGYKELTALEAQAKIKEEYVKFTINRSKTVFRHLTYYVPYLNLYPKNGLNFKFELPQSFILPPLPTPPSPPHTAELRMMIDVKGAAPEKVEIEFDPEYFEINGKSYITVNGKPEPYRYIIDRHNYTPTPDNAHTSRDVTDLASKITKATTSLIAPILGGIKTSEAATLKITCLKEFDMDKRIKVYAYPAGSSTKSREEQIQTRKLAGQLIVCANSKPNRRVQKIVLVRVRTNLEGTPTGEKVGTFDPEEINCIYKVLYQALIFPDVFPKDIGKSIILDMSKDEAFTSTEKSCGIYVDSYNPSRLRSGARGIPAYLREKFLEIKENRKYEDYLTIFSLNVTNGIGGQADIGPNLSFKKNVAIFSSKHKTALAHEVVHGLGVYHAHFNEGVHKSDQKYLFTETTGKGKRGPVIWDLGADEAYKKATSNIMSYRQNDGSYSTWRWQWLIMKRNTPIEPSIAAADYEKKYI